MDVACQCGRGAKSPPQALPSSHPPPPQFLRLSPHQSGGSPFFAGFLHHAGVDAAWKKEIRCRSGRSYVAVGRNFQKQQQWQQRWQSSAAFFSSRPPASGGAPRVLLLLLRGLRWHRGRSAASFSFCHLSELCFGALESVLALGRWRPGPGDVGRCAAAGCFPRGLRPESGLRLTEKPSRSSAEAFAGLGSQERLTRPFCQIQGPAARMGRPGGPVGGSRSLPRSGTQNM